MRRLLFILLLLAASCQECGTAVRFGQYFTRPMEKLPMQWSLSCAFPENRAQSVRDGLNYWNVQLGREVFRETEECGVFPPGNESAKVLVILVPEESIFLGTTNVEPTGLLPRDVVMRYYNGWTRSESKTFRETVSRHEAGHALGFLHSDFQRCLMYETVDEKDYAERTKDLCREELEEARTIFSPEMDKWDLSNAN